MCRSRSSLFVSIAGAAVLSALFSPFAQAAEAEPLEAEYSDTSSVGKVGREHDNLRRAKVRDVLYEIAADVYADYSKLKARTERETGLYWSMDLSYVQQWGRPVGGSPAGQLLVTPNINWDLFDSKTMGQGSVQLAYIAARYPTIRDATEIQSGLGLLTPINDYPGYQNIFSQLTYTHALPGNKLLITIGQYPFSNFDGNSYLNNQQENFSNYVLAQNGSQTYPNAGLGAYVQVNATSTVQFAAGFQNAANISGATLSGKGFREDDFAWFGYMQWTPTFRGLGSSQYSIAYYRVPAVPSQSRTSGWSVNAVQNLDPTWALFARANRAYGYLAPIEGSYAFGGAMSDPIGRNFTDQIGFALGYSKAAPPPTNPSGARNEKLVEAYWSWTFEKGILLAPDVQYIRDPALNPTRDSVWVLSLRITLTF